MGIRVTKQKDAIVTTVIFFNLVFMLFGIFLKKMFYLNIGITLFLLGIYYAINVYEDKLEIILEASEFAKKLNNVLN